MPAPTAQQQASTTAIPTHHPSNMSHHHQAAPQTPAGAAGHPGYQRQSAVLAEAPTAQAHQDSQELSSPPSGGRGGDIRDRGSKMNRSGNSATSPTRGRVSSTAGQSPPSDALGKALASVSILQKCLDLYCMQCLNIVSRLNILKWNSGSLTKNDPARSAWFDRSEEHTSELQSHSDLVCRLLLEKKKKKTKSKSLH